MKYTKYPELKARLKELAKEIRYWKGNRKEKKRAELGMWQYQIQDKIDARAYEFRHKHITYCMLRGREYEEIERYSRTSPDWNYIDAVREEHEQKTICVSS
jgi:hypothetical protein